MGNISDVKADHLLKAVNELWGQKPHVQNTRIKILREQAKINSYKALELLHKKRR